MGVCVCERVQKEDLKISALKINHYRVCAPWAGMGYSLLELVSTGRSISPSSQ